MVSKTYHLVGPEDAFVGAESGDVAALAKVQLVYRVLNAISDDV